MWLHTAVPVGISHDLRTNPQLFKKNWRRKNCWRKQLNQIRKNFQYLNCLVAFRRSKKKTAAAGLQSELEFERASLRLQAVFHFKDTFFDSLVSENQSKSTWTKETKGKLTKVLVKISDLSRGLARSFAEVRRVLQIHANPPPRLFPLGWLD